ncbi:MAG TPA: TonB-dependent receptor plug domain-containing protein [Bacteroidales bacterium]|nr:TonB-dependent receptor plug domain-containing protein [Bacteroidales bacterium]
MRLKLVLVFLVMPFLLQAMDISGMILDIKGKPAKKVQVVVKNDTQKIAYTSSDGSFKFDGVKASDSLVIYPSRNFKVTLPLNDSSFYEIRLDKRKLFIKTKESSREISYQRNIPNRPKSGFLTQEQIAKSGANDLVELLRGRIPGLQILQGDHGYMALIRGGTSMSLNSEPLFLVDGVEFEGLSAANRAVNISDIFSIEVQKEGFNYGLKGANGVIIIKCSK